MPREESRDAGWESESFRAYADHLVARGYRVVHLLGPDRSEPHELREMGVVEAGDRVVYPPPPDEQGSLF